MTLLELTTVICTKIGKTDEASLSACKMFIEQRHEQICRAHMWLDLQAYASTTLRAVRPYALATASTYPPILAMPYELDEVFAMRYDVDGDTGSNLSVEEPFWRFATRPEDFEEIGDPLGFSNAGHLGVSFPLKDWQDYGESIKIGVQNTLDAGTVVTVTGLPQTGSAEVTESKVLAYGANSLATFWRRIDLITKDRVTNDSLMVLNSTSSMSDWIGTTEREHRVPAIRLHPTPSYDASKTVNVYVVGKKRIRPMINDTDSPAVRGLDGALLALGQADMLEKSRQYAKASMKITEGMALLDSARKQDTDQTARVTRLMPTVHVTPGSADDFGW